MRANTEFLTQTTQSMVMTMRQRPCTSFKAVFDIVVAVATQTAANRTAALKTEPWKMYTIVHKEK